MTIYADLVRYRELFGSLFRRDLQAKYKGSVLGIAWSLAHPLVLMAIYVLVFSVLWQVTDDALDPYPLFLLSGLGAWIFFSTSLQASARSMLDNANLIKKTRFPRQLVPLSVVATHLVTFAVMIVGVAAVNFVVLEETRDVIWLSLPLALAFVALVGGVCLAVASLNVLFRDVEHLLAALLLPWFFLTPILYTSDTLPGAIEDYSTLVDVLHYANFVAPAITALRDPLFFGELPSAADALYLVGAAAAALAIGAFVFTRIDDRIAVEL